MDREELDNRLSQYQRAVSMVERVPDGVERVGWMTRAQRLREEITAAFDALVAENEWLRKLRPPAIFDKGLSKYFSRAVHDRAKAYKEEQCTF